MTVIIMTEHGTLRQVKCDGQPVWQLKCPECGTWGTLDDDQLHGRVSVDHTGEPRADGPGLCTYHETHNFAAALLKTPTPAYDTDRDPGDEYEARY